MKWIRTSVVMTLGFAALAGCEGEVGPDPDAPFCGGIAGFPCPGEGTCVDDPRDDCDPENGGADCGGLCQCLALGLCVEGQHWDASPEVCACVPDTPGEACGDVTCGPGLVCCNASCGICTEPGGVCIQIACE